MADAYLNLPITQQDTIRTGLITLNCSQNNEQCFHIPDFHSDKWRWEWKPLLGSSPHSLGFRWWKELLWSTDMTERLGWFTHSSSKPWAIKRTKINAQFIFQGPSDQGNIIWGQHILNDIIVPRGTQSYLYLAHLNLSGIKELNFLL